MSDFDSLTRALEGWFDTPLRDLPDAIRQRVEREFSSMPWDSLSGDQRRSVALQLDYQHDPATEQDRQFWWDFFERKRALQKQIAEWEAVIAPTAADLTLKETRLEDLRRDLTRMEQQQRQARGDYQPERKRRDDEEGASSTTRESPDRYIAYPRAMKLLAERLDATPEELAAWVWMGPKAGGLAAYLNANELDPPPRFYYGLGRGDDFDYLSPLMACWFQEEDLASFQPADRFITGKALIERWSNRPGIQPEAFIRAKIKESRLLDAHPICGGTQGSHPDDESWPSLSIALFVRAHAEAIEAEDFGDDDRRNALSAKSKRTIRAETSNWKMLVQAEAARRWAALRQSGANPTRFSISCTVLFIAIPPDVGFAAPGALTQVPGDGARQTKAYGGDRPGDVPLHRAEPRALGSLWVGQAL